MKEDGSPKPLPLRLIHFRASSSKSNLFYIYSIVSIRESLERSGISSLLLPLRSLTDGSAKYWVIKLDEKLRAIGSIAGVLVLA